MPPPKKTVAKLAKNLDQLTVIYHRLADQNSGLKGELGDTERKMQHKDSRIAELNRNLRDQKQKYDRLLEENRSLGKTCQNNLEGGRFLAQGKIKVPIRGGGRKLIPM